MAETKKEIKAFFERMLDERIDLAEELMAVAKQRVRVEGVKVTRIDYFNGAVITAFENPFADPRELVLRSGRSSALVHLEVADPEGDK